MIKSFKHKGLKELFETGKTRHISHDHIAKCRRILTMLDEATTTDDMNVAGLRFHGLHTKPKRWSVRVSGNYRITFGWENGPEQVDYEDYH